MLLSCREYQQHLCPGLHQRSSDLEWPTGPGEPPVQPWLHPDSKGESLAPPSHGEGMPTPGGVSLLPSYPALIPGASAQGPHQEGTTLSRPFQEPCWALHSLCQQPHGMGTLTPILGMRRHIVGAYPMVPTIIHDSKFCCSHLRFLCLALFWGFAPFPIFMAFLGLLTG